jgi:hypothetical protein
MKQIIFCAGVVLFMVLIATSTIVSDVNSTSATYSPSSAPSPRTEFDSIKTDLKDYMWPTDASTKITSSFAEYRSTHFHGGIDISTNGQTGYKVFAVRDGYVYRIRIMANGYGKMLYIKHHDGYYSTYSHLLSFNDSITALARKEQYRLGTYTIDLTLDPSSAPVKKGDVVAFTGESGFGPPHLHFEIRDENLNPINPLLCENFMIDDNIPPFIRRVMVSPLNAASWIDNSLRPKILSRFPGKQSRVRIPQTLRTHGLIGFGVEATDKREGTYSKAGIHSMDFYLDDSLIYAMRLDRVPAEETKEIDLHYDLPMVLHGWGKFQKLYIDSGNTLPFYNKKPTGTGIINTELLAEGEHEYRIVCKDIHGNATQLTGKLLANHQPAIRIHRIDTEEIVLAGDNLSSVEKCYVYGKKNSAYDWTQHTFGKGKFERDNDGIELPIDLQKYDVIKIIAESKWGSRSSPLFHFLKKPQGTSRDVHLTTDVFNDYVQITVTSTGLFTEAPTVTVQEGSFFRTVALEAQDLYKYAGAFVPSQEFAGARLVHVKAEILGNPSSTEAAFDVLPISATGTKAVSTLNDRLKISYDSAAVYKTLYMQASTDAFKNSTVYILEPQDVLLNKGINVSVDAGSTGDHLGLYFRANGGWVFQTSTFDPGKTTLTTTLTRTLGELVVMKDETEPTIGRLRAYASKGKALVSFRYHDNLSGVDTDEIKMYIDDVLVIPEIDGEHNRVWYKSEEPLTKGRHSLRIAMKDRMKNATEVTRLLTVR